MSDAQISIGQVKRDISALLNRVAYGGERIVLTSRGRAKAAIVSMEDYEQLIEADHKDAVKRMEAWLAASDQLAASILSHRAGELLDVDAALAQAQSELEERHDFLRSD